MDNKLYIEDKNIKVSRSTFSIFDGESIKYEGKVSKVKLPDLMIILQRRANIMDALSYEILNAIYILQFSTSRQITQYLNIFNNLSVSQHSVSNKLNTLVKLSIINQYSYLYGDNIATNMKVYSLDKNGQILLKSHHYTCDWQLTDSLKFTHSKSYLIRNQYILKLKAEFNDIDSLKLTSSLPGIGATYSINSKKHIIIPVRNYENYKDELLTTYNSLKNISYDSIIVLGEDVNFLFQIFKILVHNSMANSTVFCPDLRLFDRDLNSSLFKFYCKDKDGKIEVCMKDTPLDEFYINKKSSK